MVSGHQNGQQFTGTLPGPPRGPPMNGAAYPMPPFPPGGMFPGMGPAGAPPGAFRGPPAPGRPPVMPPAGMPPYGLPPPGWRPPPGGAPAGPPRPFFPVPGPLGMPSGIPPFGMPAFAMQAHLMRPPAGPPQPPAGLPPQQAQPGGTAAGGALPTPPQGPSQSQPHGPQVSYSSAALGPAHGALPGPPQGAPSQALLQTQHEAAGGPQPQPGAPAAAPSTGTGEQPQPSAKGSSAAASDSNQAAGQNSSEQQKREAAAWAAHKTDAGQVYYHNSLTGKSTWERPADMPAEGPAAAPAGTLVPVSSSKVKGTAWDQVECSNGSKYYYNPTTGATSWDAPPEVKDALSKMPALSAKEAAIVQRLKATTGGANLRPDLQATNTKAAAADNSSSGSESGSDDSSSDDEGPAKGKAAKHTADGAGAPPPPPAVDPARGPSSVLPPAMPGYYPPAVGAMPGMARGRGPGAFPVHPYYQHAQATAAASAANAAAAARQKARAISNYKDLLDEVGVTPFSRYERELPKMQNDARYQAIASAKERRALFDEFCRELAARKSRAKASKAENQAAAENGFLELLQEIEEHGWPEEEVQEGQAVVGLTASSTLDDIKEWYGGDERFRAASPDTRERLFSKVLKEKQEKAAMAAAEKEAMLQANYFKMLQEAGVTETTRWSKTKSKLREDHRYRAVSRAKREQLFRQYVAQLASAKEKDSKGTDNRDKELRRQLEAAQEEAAKRQQRAAHESAVSAFKTLLSEMVKEPESDWRQWKERLERDPQGRATNSFLGPENERIRMFREHCTALEERGISNYKQLLQELLRPVAAAGPKGPRWLLMVSYDDAAAAMEDDARFQRAPYRAREPMWRQVADEMQFEQQHPEHARGRGDARSDKRPPPRRGDDDNKTGADVTDAAYLREYLDVDRKRTRR